MRTMHITIPALQKRPKVLPMSLSEMLCTGTQSSGGQAVRMSVYASIMNASTTFCSPNATLRLPANSASTCGGSWAIIASNQRAAVIETRRHDGASNYAHTGATRAGICTDHHRRSVLPRQHAASRPGQPLRAGPIVRAPAPTAASTPGVRWRALRSHRQWGGQTRRTRQRMSKGWGPGCLHQRVLIGNVAGGRPIKRQGLGVGAVARHWRCCRRGVLDEHTAWSELLFPLR